MNEALLIVWWDHTAAANSLCLLSRQLNSFLTSSFQHLSYNTGGPQGAHCLATQIQHWTASSCLRQWAQAHQYHWVHSSHQWCPGFCGPSAWRYRKHHHHLGILWQIHLSLPQTLPARRHVLPRAWHHVGSFCPLGLRGHASFRQCTVGLEPCTLLLYTLVHLFIPPPGLWFPLMVL